jgi:asparagine synthase (glutamine-hydrolysing)
MCGIAGILNLDGVPADPRVMARMLELQAHRGPDDKGTRLFSLATGRSSEYVAGAPAQASAMYEGALGFVRLSILDLSIEGHQPMCNADSSLFIAFNGEIYNAFDYVPELEAAGFRFHSRTDTEVILYLYERYGLEGMLKRLNGMFVIVIVDLRKREVHVVRDHMGVKPLYWTQAGGALLIASEAKAFLAHPAFRAELDEACLDEYLAFRYCAGDRYLLKGVRQLRPGHCMRIAGGSVAVRRYWEIPDQADRLPISRAQAADQLEDLLRQSVKSQLLSDVKVGCQLSGGIDSSLVSVVARSYFDADMDSFSIVFEDPAYSEERWAREASTAAGAIGHRYPFTADDFFSALGAATWHLDQPINHPNSLGIFLLAKRAKEHVTVLLSGEGADELLGGYHRHYYAGIRSRVLPFVPLLRHLPRIGPRFGLIFGSDQPSAVDAFIAASQFQQLGQLRQIRPDVNLASAMAQRRDLFMEGRDGHLKNCLKYDQQTYLVDLLVRQDKMCMAHSLENRVPFLDRRVVDFVRKLPDDYLVGPDLTLPQRVPRQTKIVLKDLARRTFTDEFVYRPKSGFGLPLVDYFADERFEQLMMDSLLPGMKRRGLLRDDGVERLWRDLPHMGKGADEAFWISIALEIWAQHFVDAPPAASTNSV